MGPRRRLDVVRLGVFDDLKEHCLRLVGILQFLERDRAWRMRVLGLLLLSLSKRVCRGSVLWRGWWEELKLAHGQMQSSPANRRAKQDRVVDRRI